MTDSTDKVLKAIPDRLAKLLALGTHRPEELAAIYQHQMEQPVSVNLRALGTKISGKVRAVAEVNDLLLRSFRDLFRHPQPPLELLGLVKEYAKLNRDQPESALPRDVATLLYYLSIAAALVRWGERISDLNDAELRKGLAWCRRQGWIDDSARELLASAAGKLAAP